MSSTPVQPKPGHDVTPSNGASPEARWAQHDDRHALADAFVQMDDGQQLGKSFVETEHTDLKDLKGERRHFGWLWALAALVLAGLLIFFFGWLPRHKRDKEVTARAQQEQKAIPVVEVMTVKQASSEEELTLPGTVIPVNTAHIFAAAGGYLTARYADLGDVVRKGQLLARISAPELDASVAQQAAIVQQNRDAVAKAVTQQELAQVSYDRTHTLVLHGVLSQQDDDVALAALKSAIADVFSAKNGVGAALGALQRAQALAAFEQVRSPINGTITARNVEVGGLVSVTGAAQGLAAAASPTNPSGGPATGGAMGGELFQVTNVLDLRTFISVPEEDAMRVQTGQPATLTFSELPTKHFQGTIIRSSDSLSQQTRSLLLEVHIQDPQHVLRPGMFASVQLHFKSPDRGILISGDSVIPRAQGQFVGLVQDNVVHLREVHVGRDLGTQVYITGGLENGDVLVVNPTDVVQEGAHVQPKPAPKGQEK